MLHLVFNAFLEDSLLDRIGISEGVVLLDDAVYRTLRQGNKAEALVNLILRSPCYVLSEHLAIRGLSAEELVNGIQIIDYAGLVNLTIAHSTIQTWN